MTLEPKYQHILQKGDCLTIEQLKLYIHDRLPAGERFQAEKHLIECEICNDLLEGLSVYENADEFTNAEIEVRNRVQTLLNGNKGKQRSLFIRRWSVAAGIAILVSAGALLLIVIPYKKDQMVVAEKSENGKAQKVIATDSITQVLANVEIKAEKEVSVIHKKENTELGKKLLVENETNKYAAAASSFDMENNESAASEDTFETEVIPIVATVEFEDKQEDTSVILAEEILSGKVSGVNVSRNVRSENVNSTQVWGIITDETGEPVIGATVMVKGTTNATITDMNGNFELNMADSNATLLISFIGYDNKEVNAIGGNETRAVLEPSAMALSEVVVVGYGTQKKSMNTGAVTVIQMEPEKYDPETARRQILSDIEHIKSSADFRTNYKKIKKVAIKYLQLEDSRNALIYVEMLSHLSKDEMSLNLINETISLVRQSDYKQAIKKLKKLKENP